MPFILCKLKYNHFNYMFRLHSVKIISNATSVFLMLQEIGTLFGISFFEYINV